ncbi:hypothetical protein HOLleu_24661 [Holothuria leucospilota]|uniref:C2H2-type domain-containing protein n=1 Tax=Holothuria leucospilota TaxID=206669 RepID=A0A9Q1BRJ3_HOLLE|nr:hypothetical protein HOLleu_24661 [Holothuria leucospilota]
MGRVMLGSEQPMHEPSEAAREDFSSRIISAETFVLPANSEMIVEARVKNFQKEFAGEVGIIQPNMAGTWGVKYECQRCGRQNGSIADREHHARKRHGTILWTCENCKEYHSERKWDVQRHEVGCKRRSRTVTTETVGEWDVNPGGTKTDVKGKRESREKESNERSEGKEEKKQTEPVTNTDEEEDEKAGEKRKVQEAQGSCKRRVLKGGLKSLDPPLVQRVPTLAYLTALGSPIEKPKMPKQETQGSEREQGEKVTKEEESGMVVRADMKDRKDRVSYEIDVGPGTVWRKIVRKTHHVDGRVTIEEKEEILRVCDCKNVQKN